MCGSTLTKLLLAIVSRGSMGQSKDTGCPSGKDQPWLAFLDSVNTGWTYVQQGRIDDGKRTLADALTSVTSDAVAAHDCSLGLAAAYRVLALAHVGDPRLQGRARLRALQVGLRFMNLASNWLTHDFVKHNADVRHIDESPWPITLQESADEHRLVMSMLSEGGMQAGNRPVSVHIPPDFRHPRLSIAIVSLCAYPEGHVLPGYAISNHQMYAQRHGYDYHVATELVDSKRPPAWGKIRLMQRYVQKRRWDWVIWADCDTFFMNLSITLDSILYRYGSHNPSASRSLEELTLRSDFHFLVTEDHAMLNTGIFFARSSSWSEGLLERVWGDENSIWTNHPWWEQAAMCWDFWGDLPQKFRVADHTRWASDASLESDEMEGIYPSQVRVAPQIEFNSYHPVTSRMLADTWTPGKFVLAFNGVVSSSSPNVAKELYGRYYELFCKLNHVQQLCLSTHNFPPWL